MPGKAEREGQVPLRMPMQASVIGHPSGQLGELGTHRGEPGTGPSVEAAIREQWRHLRVQVVHNCTAHPAAAEPVVQFPVGLDNLLIASMSDSPTCRRPVPERAAGAGLTSHCKAAAEEAEAATAESSRNRRRSKSALHNVSQPSHIRSRWPPASGQRLRLPRSVPCPHQPCSGDGAAIRRGRRQSAQASAPGAVHQPASGRRNCDRRPARGRLGPPQCNNPAGQPFMRYPRFAN